MNCQKCGETCYREDKFCGNCGNDLKRYVEVYNYCPKCGENYLLSFTYCKECGSKLQRIED